MQYNAYAYRLYRTAHAKYLRFKSRLDKSIRSGQFARLSLKKRRSLIHRIKKLLNKIQRMSFELKVGMSAAAMVLALSTADVHAQQLGPFAQGLRTENPLRSPFQEPIGRQPAASDVDDDGDIDVVFGTSGTDAIFFRNDGTAASPAFIKITGIGNPFEGTQSGSYNTVAFEDLDGDGDEDLAMVDEFGNSIFWRKDGPNLFTQVTGPGDPLNSLILSDGAQITFADVDGSGDVDLVSGFAYDGGGEGNYLVMFDGPGFARNDFFDGFGSSGEEPLTPAFIDVDGDTDLDMFLGITDIFGTGANIQFYRQEPIGNFTQETGPANPLDGFTFRGFAAPLFVDLDNDGDFDMIVGQDFFYEGTYSSSIAYLENKFNTTGVFEFERKTRLDNPFGGVDVGHAAAPEFVDIDGDGDLDAFVGGKYFNSIGFVEYYENEGNSQLVRKTSPLNGLPTTRNQNPSFVDLNGDSDVDFFLDMNDDILYYENTGNTSSISLGPANTTLLEPDVAGIYYYKTAFSDVDEDGDQDAVYGRQPGNLFYFKNDGTPGFASVSIPLTGLTGTDLSSNPVPEFVDIDHDGLEDLFVGKSGGTILFFPKTGSEAFDLSMTPTANPLNGFSVNSIAVPTFADMDLDGDLDAFIGNYDGHVVYFKNQNEAPGTTSNTPNNSFTEDSSPIPIDPSISITDDTGDEIIQATIAIAANYQSGEEVISVTLQGGVTGSFDAGTGIYTITGTETLANYQAMLQSATYVNNSQNPDTAPRTIDFAVTDFDNTDPLLDGIPEAETVVAVVAVNDAPGLNTNGGSTAYTENDAPVIIDATVVPFDIDNSNLAGATVSITANFVSAEDALVFTNQNGITGSYDAGTGILTLTGTATVADYQLALQSVSYQNSSENPGTAARTIEFIVDDGADQSNITTHTVNVTAVNDAPTLSSTLGSPPDYTGGDYIIDNTIIVADADNTSISSATVSIASGLVTTDDELVFVNQGGITGSYNAATGVLTLTGSASLATYQAALRSIAYRNLSATPPVDSRTFEFEATDGSANSNNTSVVVAINVVTGSPPVITAATINISTGSIATVSLPPLITDPDGDADLTTLSIVQAPASGSLASISVSDDLVVDYSAGTFAGSETAIIEVCDALSNCAQQTFTFNVANSPPNATVPQQSVNFNGNLTVDLSALVTDAEGNLDPAAFSIIQQPSSGAAASLSGASLTLNYAVTNFAGNDSLVIEACDLVGVCTQVTVSVNIANGAPTISISTQQIGLNGSVSIDLSSVISDPDNNLDPATFQIVSQPESGAPASITNGVLTVDYSNSNFAGNDELTIEACDLAGVCTQQVITIEVEGDIIVYNGISPNGDGLNDDWLIENIVSLAPENRVSIFSRWGDVVFEAENYDNTTVVFRGLNNNGNELASGTYFYEIEFSDNRPSLTGYLVIKR